MILITSYNRPKMLLRLLKQLDGNVAVIDDGSDYSPIEHMEYCDYYRTSHKGKAGYWVNWNLMLDIARESGDDWFMFTQDDVKHIQIDTLRQVTKGLDYYAFNIMNVGTDRGWTPIKRTKTKLNGLECYNDTHVDCNFVTNRETLDKIGWELDPIDPERFRQKNVSSGVGQQLSKRMYENNITMFTPVKSLAFHGDHWSEMHPIERKLNPLVSR